MATIIGNSLRRIIQHFPDPVMELDYLTEQRSRQAKFTKMMTRIIGVAILAYVVTSFVFLQEDAFKTVGFAQIYFIPVLLGYSWAGSSMARGGCPQLPISTPGQAGQLPARPPRSNSLPTRTICSTGNRRSGPAITWQA